MFTFRRFSEPKDTLSIIFLVLPLVELRRCLHVSSIIPRIEFERKKKKKRKPVHCLSTRFARKSRKNSKEMAVQPVGRRHRARCHVATVAWYAYVDACMHTCGMMVYQFRGFGRLRRGRKGDVIGAHGLVGGHRVARKFRIKREEEFQSNLNLEILRSSSACHETLQLRRILRTGFSL